MIMVTGNRNKVLIIMITLKLIKVDGKHYNKWKQREMFSRNKKDYTRKLDDNDNREHK